jgi:hypothetical protein
MYVLGTYLNLCDPNHFYDAWQALGDLTDDDCEVMAALLAKEQLAPHSSMKIKT